MKCRSVHFKLQCALLYSQDGTLHIVTVRPLPLTFALIWTVQSENWWTLETQPWRNGSRCSFFSSALVKLQQSVPKATFDWNERIQPQIYSELFGSTATWKFSTWKIITKTENGKSEIEEHVFGVCDSNTLQHCSAGIALFSDSQRTQVVLQRQHPTGGDEWAIGRIPDTALRSRRVALTDHPLALQWTEDRSGEKTFFFIFLSKEKYNSTDLGSCESSQDSQVCTSLLPRSNRSRRASAFPWLCVGFKTIKVKNSNLQFFEKQARTQFESVLTHFALQMCLENTVVRITNVYNFFQLSGQAADAFPFRTCVAGKVGLSACVGSAFIANCDKSWTLWLSLIFASHFGGLESQVWGWTGKTGPKNLFWTCHNSKSAQEKPKSLKEGKVQMLTKDPSSNKRLQSEKKTVEDSCQFSLRISPQVWQDVNFTDLLFEFREGDSSFLTTKRRSRTLNTTTNCKPCDWPQPNLVSSSIVCQGAQRASTPVSRKPLSIASPPRPSSPLVSTGVTRKPRKVPGPVSGFDNSDRQVVRQSPGEQT